MAAATPKFIADAMLGRLAKWLRLLGLDTLYDPRLSDAALLRRAIADGRILLTRDTRLLRRRRLPPHLYVRSDDFRSQLRQVVDAFAIDPTAHRFERCACCNTVLRHADKVEVESQVPAYVSATQTTFARCPDCGRIYWPATHVERIERELRPLESKTGRRP
jgi:uncharacterized protein with PIN domain